jgi:hypothetical protein
MGNRDNTALLAAVNAYRAANNLGPIAASQIDSNRANTFDLRVSRAFRFGGDRRVELVGQVFNLFGTDNLGPAGIAWTTNALSDSFGRILAAKARQQGELAVTIRF